MDLTLLRSELVKEDLLKKIIYFDELESTNEYAKKNENGDDVLVITPTQTKGTGRFGKTWQSTPHKDLTFSLVKKIKMGIDDLHTVNFYSSYILCYSLKKIYNECAVNFSLKWPNDILANKKKAAGFLLDVKDLKKDEKKFIIGVGININETEFCGDLSGKATSLRLETGSEMRIEEILIAYIKNFYINIFLINTKAELMKKWKSNTDIIGKKISYRQRNDEIEKTAKIIDIDLDGGLRIKTNSDKTLKFYSGEINILYE